MDTSDVMRQNFVHAQQFLGTWVVKDLGFAPQRFNSHARPLGRTSRRWQALFVALGVAVDSANAGRRALAIEFLTKLGGENSWRVLLGGMLADIAAEHHVWVQSGPRQTRTLRQLIKEPTLS